jgi:hypothetical protein
MYRIRLIFCLILEFGLFDEYNDLRYELEI